MRVRRAFNRGPALLVAALVLATGVIAAPERKASAAPPNWSEARVKALPALASDAPPRQRPEIPEGDFSDMSGRSTKPRSSFDAQRSLRLDAQTTETAEVFENSDGTRTAVISQNPVRFRDDVGRWRDIDLDLAPGSDGKLRPRAARSAPVLAARAAGAYTTIPTSQGDITISHPDAADVPAITTRNVARYDDALPGGRDLIAEVLPSGVKESVIVPAPGGPSSYRVELTLPAGLSARAGAAGVEIIDSAGTVIATYAGGIAHDSAKTASGLGAETQVDVRLVSTRARVATVEVSVDARWLADPARIYPVVIDPTTTGSLATDTFVQTGLGAQGSSTELRTGTFDGGATVARSLLRFTLPTTLIDPGKYWVQEAHLALYNATSTSCVATPVDLSGIASSFTDATTVADQPGIDEEGRVSRTSFSHGATGCAAGSVNLDATTLANRWVHYGDYGYGLNLRAADETDSASWKTYASGNAAANQPILSMTYETTPGGEPANGSTLTTTTPTLNGSATEGAARLYKVTTGRDGETGTVVTSGWLSSYSQEWTVPTGVLEDGVTYYWHVWGRTAAGVVYPRPYWVKSFKVDLRLGAKSALPFDAAGPVSVNLATGNAVAAVATPTFPTVGGTIGLGLVYNTQTPQRYGLIGSYYADTNANRIIDAGETPMVVRRDAQVNFDWAASSGYPSALPNDNVIVSWQGFFTAPTAGTYELGATSDDGVRVTLNGITVLDRWFNQTTTTPAYGSGVYLAANQTVPIKVDYYDATGGSQIALYAKGAVSETIVPSSWLSRSNDALPAGWSMAADLDGAYAGAKITESGVTILEQSGTARSFTWTGSGYQSPPEDESVLAKGTDGTLTLHGADGVTYTFDAAGNVVSAATAMDDRAPAKPVHTYSGTPTRLRTITDPVTGRAATLRYGGDAACPSPAPSGFDSSAPTNTLCSVSFWDGSVTKLWYVSAQLARVENPGAEIADFSYTAGRLSAVRSPLTTRRRRHRGRRACE